MLGLGLQQRRLPEHPRPSGRAGRAVRALGQGEVKKRVVWRRFGRTGGPELTGRLPLSLVRRWAPRHGEPASHVPERACIGTKHSALPQVPIPNRPLLIHFNRQLVWSCKSLLHLHYPDT